MKIKNIIFDFDGTIADTLPIMLEAFNSYVENQGLHNITKQNIEEYRNTPPRELLKTFNIPIYKVPGLVRHYSEHFYSSFENVNVVDGMYETIKKLEQQDIQMGIVTSNKEDLVKNFLNKFDLEVFNFIYSQRKVFKKNNTLTKAINEYNLKLESTIYIGDEVRDIEASRKAGLKSGAVTWGLNGEKIITENHPDHIFRTPKEILSIV